jgi:hypothetical protein
LTEERAYATSVKVSTTATRGCAASADAATREAIEATPDEM